MTLEALLSSYTSRYPEEEVYRDMMLKLLEIEGDHAFSRACLVGQFTASSWLVNSTNDQYVLMHHRRLDRWFQPGGHCDEETDVLAVAIKEAKEETGLIDIVPMMSAIFDLDIHFIPPKKKDHTHLHFDVRFLLQAQNDKLSPNQESFEVRWFDQADQSLITEQALLRMYQKWSQSHT